MTEPSSVEISSVLRNLASDAAGLVQSVRSALPAETDVLQTKQGISLFTLKNAALLDYLHHLILLCASRLRGRLMNDDANARIVRNLIELRLVLEKIRPVEGRTRGLVERLMRATDEEEKRIREGRTDEADNDTQEEIDPLAFRPNIAALSSTTNGAAQKEDGTKKPSSTRDQSDGVYRPPRLAPVVYNPDAVGGRKGASKERLAPRNAALLSDLSASMSSNPYETSSGGVGVGGTSGSSSSARAKALERMQRYEEDNFTRLIMSKKDAKRRRRDEADVALGGAGMSSKRGRVGAGLEEEFGDLLRNSTEMRNVKRGSALQRARSSREDVDDGLSSRASGKTTFQKKKRNDASRRR